jgi:hypothetical protein
VEQHVETGQENEKNDGLKMWFSTPAFPFFGLGFRCSISRSAPIGQKAENDFGGFRFATP